MSHFHGVRHIRGGFDMDETTIDPNANYWLRCARGAFQQLERAIGTEKAMKVAPERQPGQTWKSVCECYELLADLAEKQVERVKIYQLAYPPLDAVELEEYAADYAERRDLYTMGMGG